MDPVCTVVVIAATTRVRAPSDFSVRCSSQTLQPTNSRRRRSQSQPPATATSRPVAQTSHAGIVARPPSPLIPPPSQATGRRPPPAPRPGQREKGITFRPFATAAADEHSRRRPPLRKQPHRCTQIDCSCAGASHRSSAWPSFVVSLFVGRRESGGPFIIPPPSAAAAAAACALFPAVTAAT